MCVYSAISILASYSISPAGTTLRTITYQGLSASRGTPLILIITAFNISGGILDTISRPVRLGKIVFLPWHSD